LIFIKNRWRTLEHDLPGEATVMKARSSKAETPSDEDAATLTISPEKVCFIIVKAREFDAKDQVTEPRPRAEAIRPRSGGPLRRCA
jgi:hypothetical protein